MSERLKVVYIMGSGRSGSTVLDTVLGNHACIESVGELANAGRAWGSTNEYCSCGLRAGDCGFWKDVKNDWESRLPSALSSGDWWKLQREFERIRSLFKTMRHGARQSTMFEQYATGIRELYRALQAVSGAEFIVDSSKNPVRALALSYVQDIDLKLIHLVRDPRGVAWSYKKPYKQNSAGGVQVEMSGEAIARTSLRWRLANNLSEMATRCVSREDAFRIRYEDFVFDPEGVLHEVGNMIGLDFSWIISGILQGGGFNVGHSIAGNRVRMSGEIRLRPDVEWRDHLNSADRAIVGLLAGPMMKRYRYSPTGVHY